MPAPRVFSFLVVRAWHALFLSFAVLSAVFFFALCASAAGMLLVRARHGFFCSIRMHDFCSDVLLPYDLVVLTCHILAVRYRRKV